MFHFIDDGDYSYVEECKCPGTYCKGEQYPSRTAAYEALVRFLETCRDNHRWIAKNYTLALRQAKRRAVAGGHKP